MSHEEMKGLHRMMLSAYGHSGSHSSHEVNMFCFIRDKVGKLLKRIDKKTKEPQCKKY